MELCRASFSPWLYVEHWSYPTPWFAPIECCLRNPQALTVATYGFLAHTRIGFSRGPYTERLKCRQRIPQTVYVEPLYVAVDGPRMPMHFLRMLVLWRVQRRRRREQIASTAF
jgi:hypothetical protein